MEHHFVTFAAAWCRLGSLLLLVGLALGCTAEGDSACSGADCEDGAPTTTDASMRQTCDAPPCSDAESSVTAGRGAPACVETDCDVVGPAGVVDGGTGSPEASPDAGTTTTAMSPSTSSNAPEPPPAGACEATGLIAWRWDGGLVAERYDSVLEDGSYVRTRARDASTGPVRCEGSLAECDGNGVGFDELTGLLADTAVVAAVAAAPVLYGRDSRPVDGQVFRIEIAGAEILLGDATDDAHVPPSLIALRDTLLRIDAEHVASCGTGCGAGQVIPFGQAGECAATGRALGITLCFPHTDDACACACGDAADPATACSVYEGTPANVRCD